VDRDEARRRVIAARVARLATINADSTADLVPITYVLIDDHTLVTAVDHKPKRTTALRRLDNVRARPDVTVLVDEYDDDWSQLWWVRLRGTAVVIEPGEPDHRGAVDPLVDKYEQYRERRPAGAAIVVTVTEWRAWP
jgi:PPOX class probable F420-dependent enzyme